MLELDWRGLLPESEWRTLRPVLAEAADAGMRFQLGGGMAQALYGRRRRLTKDVDLFVLPEQRQAFIDLLCQHQFEDYFEQLPYERHWIYRGHRQGALLDVIWQMPNHLAVVDEKWMSRGHACRLDGLAMTVIPLEEMIWAKIFVLQRDRCDWPDLFNVLACQVEHVDWEHLLARVGHDAPLLEGLLRAFQWLCPEESQQVPARVWWRLSRTRHRQPGTRGDTPARADLLDRRDWFGPGPPPSPQEAQP